MCNGGYHSKACYCLGHRGEAGNVTNSCNNHKKESCHHGGEGYYESNILFITRIYYEGRGEALKIHAMRTGHVLELDNYYD